MHGKWIKHLVRVSACVFHLADSRRFDHFLSAHARRSWWCDGSRHAGALRPSASALRTAISSSSSFAHGHMHGMEPGPGAASAVEHGRSHPALNYFCGDGSLGLQSCRSIAFDARAHQLQIDQDSDRIASPCRVSVPDFLHMADGPVFEFEWREARRCWYM